MKIKQTLYILKNFPEFIGEKTTTLLYLTIPLGLTWFIAESSFVFVLQVFLSALDLIKLESTFIPYVSVVTPTTAFISLITFGFLRAATSACKEYLSLRIYQSFIRTFRERIVKHALTKPDEISSYETLNLFNERIHQTASVIQSLGGLTISLTSSLLFFLFGLYLAPLELITGFTLIGILYLPLSLINKRIILIGKDMTNSSKKLTELIFIALKNRFLIKIYNLSNAEINKTSNQIILYESLVSKFGVLSSFKNSFPTFAGAAIISVISFFSIKSFGTEPVKLVSFVYIFMRLAQSLSEGSATFNSIRLNIFNFKSLYNWNSNFTSTSNETLEEQPRGVEIQDIEEIVIKNLSFGFTSESYLLKNINLSLRKSSVLLIKGRSGTGKSTFLNIVLGHLKPLEGTVTFNGLDIEECQKSIADKIAYVGPEPYLIEGTIAENLMYGYHQENPPSKNEMENALEAAQLKEFISSLKGGINYHLNEFSTLSTGQKQRLAIARALLRKPQLLIFDEATANLDEQTEFQIINLISSISKKFITLLISHKNSFDRISTDSLNL